MLSGGVGEGGGEGGGGEGRGGGGGWGGWGGMREWGRGFIGGGQTSPPDLGAPPPTKMLTLWGGGQWGLRGGNRGNPNRNL